MTAPVEASVPTVQPSATVFEDAEMAVAQAVIPDISANLVEGLVEGHLYQLVGGRFIECELTQSGSVRACSSVPSTPLSTVVTSEQPSYAEVVSIEKTTLPASTGLEDDLAKLSTNTVETAENPEVDNIREDQREAVAGPGKGDRPDPKQAANSAYAAGALFSLSWQLLLLQPVRGSCCFSCATLSRASFSSLYSWLLPNMCKFSRKLQRSAS